MTPRVKKILKRTGLALLAVIVVLGVMTYTGLKEAGIIPREIYETVAPEIPVFTRPAVLVLNKANGYIHKDALPAADMMLQRIAADKGWDIFLTDNAATHNAEELEKFDLVVWNNVSGDVLTHSQRAALQQWLEDGGGWVGLHAAGGDFTYQWRWYVDTLIGAQFIGHTMHPQFQDADVLVADAALPLTAGLPAPWRIAQEEWYAFDQNPRDKNYEILLTLDENSYITKGRTWIGNDHMDGEHPIAWRHALGQGRVFYSAIGHQAATYRLPEYQEFIARAMDWAMDHPQE